METSITLSSVSTGPISIVCAALLAGCSQSKPPQPPDAGPAPKRRVAERRITEDPQQALATLEQQRRRAIEDLRRDPKDLGAQTMLVEILALRLELLGDLDALQHLTVFTKPAPAKPRAQLLRSRALGAVGRYREALKALERSGAPDVEARRLGLRIRAGLATTHETRALVERAPDFTNHSHHAMALANTGQVHRADRAFLEALKRTPNNSPFTVAWIQLMRGRMWSARDRARAAALFSEALTHLPQCLPAAIALSRLSARPKRAARALLEASNHPEALALLAAETPELAPKAKARFEALLSAHPNLFAPSAARYFLTLDAKPATQRALALAKLHLKEVQTPQALTLGLRAATKAQDRNLSCSLAKQAAPHLAHNPALAKIAAATRCPGAPR